MPTTRTCLCSMTLALGLAALSLNPGSARAQTPPPASLVAAEVAPSAETVAIKGGEKLTLARVVEIARRMKPQILAAQGSIDASQSRVGQAQSGYYPQIDGTAGYNRLSPAGNTNGIVVSSSSDQYAAGLTVNQKLYDFGKTATQVEIQRTNLDSSRADLAAVDDQVVFNAKLAYFDLLKADRNRAVALETVKQFEQHLEQAKGFFEAGVKPKYDVTKAEVDLSNAKLNLIRVEMGVRLARVQLNNAMGLPTAPDYELADDLRLEPFVLPFDQALALAYDRRPDLKALLLRKRAAEQGVELARKGYFPSLSGNASVFYSGVNLPMDEGWSMGMALSVPIFNGQQTRYQIDEARANAAILNANEGILRQAIHKELQQGYIVLQEADELISATKITVQQAEENSEIATGRYEAGVGTPIEVTDADVLLVNARTNHIQALYGYQIAQTRIEQSIGSAYGTTPGQEGR